MRSIAGSPAPEIDAAGPSQPRVDRLALHGEYAEHALMHPVERLAPDATFELPGVIAVDEDAGLGRKDVERREAQVRHPIDRPHVAAVGVNVAIDLLAPVLLAVEQRSHIESAGSGDTERCDGGVEAGL